MVKSRYSPILDSGQNAATRLTQPWDLDSLPPELLRSVYADMAAFVGWLRGPVGVTVPDCWYFHGWSARRLAALMAWHSDANGKDGTGHTASEWWASLWGLAGLREDWKEIAPHGGRHGKDVTMPTLAEWVDALTAGELAVEPSDRNQASAIDAEPVA